MKLIERDSKKMKIADIADELNNHKNIDFYNELLNNSITELACGVNFCGSKPHSIFVRDVDRGIRCYEENGLIYTLDRIINYLKNS